MKDIVNISGYKFVALDNLESLKEQFLMRIAEFGIRGTILLSAEGINVMLAGKREGIDAFYAYLDTDECLSGILFKESFSDEIPFRRSFVKIKKEIIGMKVESAQPLVEGRAAHVTPVQFKQWMDEGREMTVLDTRNDYEVRMGTFENAMDLDIEYFRDFPKEAEKQLDDSLKEQPLVMFCTGGVRCEKAAIELEHRGFKEVYQLDGGILKYFEECGGEHYQGDCFVFDERVALDPQLNETGAIQCKVCDEPLTKEEQSLPSFIDGESCPYCINQSKTA